MKIKYPHTISNGMGETLVFIGIQAAAAGDKLLVENFVMPGAGPVMHTHWLQDECLTVVSGRIGYEIQGQPLRYASKGETVLFKRGVPHRFWNDGNDTLHCKGWVQPVNTFPFYLSTIFNAQKRSGTAQPEKFDLAFLLTRYSAEYDIHGIPYLVKKIIIPATYYIGRLLGKYRHFKNAPPPKKL